MNVDKSQVAAEIEALEANISASTVTIEESKAAAHRVNRAVNNNDVAAMRSDSIKEDLKKGRLYSDTCYLDRLRETMSSDLMKVTTRYLVTTAQSLESPAGFHPDSGVFIQTAVAIHTDTLKGLPWSNKPLKSFEVNEPQEEA